MDVLDDFLTVDNNQPPYMVCLVGSLIIPFEADCYYKYRTKGFESDNEICYIWQNRIDTVCVEFCSWLCFNILW